MKSSLYLYVCLGDTKSQVSVHTIVRTPSEKLCYGARCAPCYKRKSAVCYSCHFLQGAKFLTYLFDASDVILTTKTNWGGGMCSQAKSPESCEPTQRGAYYSCK